MATIGDKPSDWDKYVRLNPNSTQIDYVVENNMVNIPVYKSVALKETVTSVSAGDKVKIYTKNFTQIGRSKYANVRVGTQTGILRITAIRKPGTTSGGNVERRYLDFTRQQLREMEDASNIGIGNPTGVSLFIPGIGMRIGITDIEKVTNTIHGREAKSDFVFKNSLGKGVLYISHKAGSGPAAFRQYGGISEKAGDIQDSALIYNHPEVQQHLIKLQRLYSDAIGGRSIPANPFTPSGVLNGSVYTMINDATLINQSVFGPSFGGDFGPDNVHLVGQGQFIFRPMTNDEGDLYFILGFSGKMALNGQIATDFANNSSGYRAVIITSAKPDRNTKTPNGIVPLVRTGIYPKSFKPGAIPINSLV